MNVPAQDTATQSIAENLPRLARRWRAGEMADASFAAGYFLIWQIALHGRRFAARQSRAVEPPAPAAWRETLLTANDAELRRNLLDWFCHYRFFRVIPAVPLAFCGWLERRWPLRLLTHIPAPLEVLSLQSDGVRPVTVLAECPRALRPVLNKVNGYEFLVHDLEHGYRFYHDPGQHLGQRCLFALLHRAIANKVFQPFLDEAEFARQFDYLISDMNTHPIHGLRFLAAVLIECQLRREGKTHGQRMSPRGKAELRSLMQTLGDHWGFSSDGRTGLEGLLDRPMDDTMARALEEAILGADMKKPNPEAGLGWAGQ